MNRIVICEPCMKGVEETITYAVDEEQIAECLACRVKVLEEALSDTPCLCIGPKPSVDEGTMCSRCAALEGGKQDG